MKVWHTMIPWSEIMRNRYRTGHDRGWDCITMNALGWKFKTIPVPSAMSWTTAIFTHLKTSCKHTLPTYTVTHHTLNKEEEDLNQLQLMSLERPELWSWTQWTLAVFLLALFIYLFQFFYISRQWGPNHNCSHLLSLTVSTFSYLYQAINLTIHYQS
jgi:hypothetical protein